MRLQSSQPPHPGSHACSQGGHAFCLSLWLPQELTEADADKLAALLERRLGKPFDEIGLEDMTAEVVQEVRSSL